MIHHGTAPSGNTATGAQAERIDTIRKLASAGLDAGEIAAVLQGSARVVAMLAQSAGIRVAS